MSRLDTFLICMLDKYLFLNNLYNSINNKKRNNNKIEQVGTTLLYS